jgi:hypothetical protein
MGSGHCTEMCGKLGLSGHRMEKVMFKWPWLYYIVCCGYVTMENVCVFSSVYLLVEYLYGFFTEPKSQDNIGPG